ncbi:MAG: DUF1232 domain-containing protein [Synergistaceae bacterium]|jgi:uncharacterized membrane protein YkvA (DUF1232 family)|nr:DUF1232 domain-containing protein [Synergistaceae bacterium]
MGLKAKLSERAQKAASDTAALFLALKRKETPLSAKILIGIAVCYALSPIDLIPDFIPVIGLLDDAILLPLIIAAAVKLTPPPVIADCRREAAGMWAGGKPKKYLCAAPVAVIWLAIIAGIIRAFL